MDTAALLLVIIGALNWGLISLFQFDLVAWIGGGQGALLSRIIYGIVAIAGIWCITLLFRDRRAAPAGAVLFMLLILSFHNSIRNTKKALFLYFCIAYFVFICYSIRYGLYSYSNYDKPSWPEELPWNEVSNVFCGTRHT